MVGVGPTDQAGLSLGALKAIKNAEELWLLDLGPARFERRFLRDDLNRSDKVVNIFAHNLIPSLPRDMLYQFYVSRVVHLLRQGRHITFLYSGNPLVWVDAMTLFKMMAYRYGFKLRITPSMSFLDTLFEKLPFLSMRNLQLRMGSVENPDISPDIDCVVGQVGEKGPSDALYRALGRLYGADHPIYLVANHSIQPDSVVEAATPPTLRSALSRWPDAQGWFVSLVIPSVRNVGFIKGMEAQAKAGQRSRRQAA